MEPWKTVQFPEEAGVSSAGLLKYLDAVAASGLEHHSILVLRHGKLACKMNFAPYDEQTPHVLFSLSKSFTSAAAGFAVQEGILSWDSLVMDVLPDKMPDKPSERHQRMTLHHLLTMGSGLDPRSDEWYDVEDWAKKILSFDCEYEPGTYFHYNSHGTYLVSCMVQRVTGMSIRDYLLPRLFEPLGIPAPDWDVCPQGVCVGGWGLHLSSDSIARFGQCLLQKGMWEGKQVLPAEWLEKATVKQIDNSNGSPEPENEWHQGYGYQFWRTRGNRFRGDGMFGQICMVSPEKDMVVAITAGIDDMGQEMQLLHEYLFPAADMEPGTAEEQAELQARIAALNYPWPEHDESQNAPVGTYTDGEATLTIDEDGTATILLDGDTLRFGPGCKRYAEESEPGSKTLHFEGVYGMQNGKMTLLERSLEAPYAFKGECVFDDEGAKLTVSGVGFYAGKQYILPKK